MSFSQKQVNSELLEKETTLSNSSDSLNIRTILPTIEKTENGNMTTLYEVDQFLNIIPYRNPVSEFIVETIDP